MNTRLIQIAPVVLVLMLTGCGLIPYKEYTNTQVPPPATAPPAAQAPPQPQASFTLRAARYVQVDGGQVDCSPKKYADVLVMLALSGGGSRASLLSALAMEEMQNVRVGESNLLAEVDLISSVSGGSLPAAYYALSADPPGACAPAACRAARSGRIWDRATVTALMTKDYRHRGMLNWLSPGNFVLYWFTTYNRSDIMAETLDSNLYTAEPSGRSLTFADLNPGRPNIVINATLASQDEGGEYAFGQPFTFTTEDFARIGSVLDDYQVARGVMASLAFPGYFNFMTLRNFRAPNGKKEYVHVFDGGNSDNLGLTSLKREIWLLHRSGRLAHYRKIVVILIDAYGGGGGVSTASPDARAWYDYVVDTNIVTATDSLLARNRVELLNQFETTDIFPYGHTEWEEAQDPKKRQIRKHQVTTACERFFSWESRQEAQSDCQDTDWDALNREVGSRLLFEHVGFKDVGDPGLRNQIKGIPTDLTFRGTQDPQTGLTDIQALECAVPLLIGTGDAAGCGGKYRMLPEVREHWQALVRAMAPLPPIVCQAGQGGDGCQSAPAQRQ